ncbi:MAG: hypothetical protein DMF72_06850 [Acidobacteria bacterium]|nr:MAG: hypothetical protein DMF72_06850 [Acidobacteriota bacterium]
MKLNNMKNFGGAILGLLLFLGITLVSSTTAQAQYPYQDQDYYRRQRQYERERQERERQLQLERQRQASQGGWYDQYGNWHSNSSNNQGYYNQGYYNQGYYNQGSNRRGRNADNYGNYGGSYQMRQTALNAGYNAGVRAGRDDRRNGRYNPYGHGEYRSGTRDFNSGYGDRSAYQQYFREAFINGYADGYRGY